MRVVNRLHSQAFFSNCNHYTCNLVMGIKLPIQAQVIVIHKTMPEFNYYNSAGYRSEYEILQFLVVECTMLTLHSTL